MPPMGSHRHPPPDDPPQPAPAAGGEFEQALLRSLDQALAEAGPGRAEVRVSRHPSVPYAGVRVEVVPRNPRAAPIEVVFDALDVCVFAGTQGCARHLPLAEACSAAGLRLLRGLFRAVMRGTYREAVRPHGRWVRRVDGFTGPDAATPVVSDGRLWIYGPPRTVAFEPY